MARAKRQKPVKATSIHYKVKGGKAKKIVKQTPVKKKY
jgi:hypothetical protein